MKIRQFFGHWLFAAILILGVQSGKIHKKVRRSALSLPEGSSVSIIMDIIVPVVPLLNTTLTYLWFDFPVTYDVPTAVTLNDLYASLGFIDNTSTLITIAHYNLLTFISFALAANPQIFAKTAAKPVQNSRKSMDQLRMTLTFLHHPVVEMGSDQGDRECVRPAIYHLHIMSKIGNQFVKEHQHY